MTRTSHVARSAMSVRVELPRDTFRALGLRPGSVAYLRPEHPQRYAVPAG